MARELEKLIFEVRVQSLLTWYQNCSTELFCKKKNFRYKTTLSLKVKWGYVLCCVGYVPFLCQLHCKARPSGVSLESPGQENIPQVSENRAYVSQNYDARKAASANLSILRWSGAKLLGPEAGKSAFEKFCCFHFTPNQDKQELV